MNLSHVKRYVSNLAHAVAGRPPKALVDDGTPSTPYHGASSGRRLYGWFPTTANINSLLLGSGETIRARSRDLVRNNSWASEISAEWTSNAIGTGIMPDFQHPDPNVKRLLDEGWKRFADNCDAESRLDFYGMQALACSEIIESGEILARIRIRPPSERLTVPIEIQMLEGEHLPYWGVIDAPNGNPVRMGIEFNKFIPSRREAYHLYREHPGAGATAPTMDLSLLSRVPAEYIVHAYRMVRVGQMRGETWLAQTIAKLYQFDQFVDATLGRQKLGAFLFAWISNINGEPFGGTTTASLGNQTAPDGTKFMSLEPDTITPLPPGEELNFFKQPDISTQYQAFVDAQLREIFASCGMTLEMFDPSKVNFSSIRAGVQKYRRRCEQFQYNTVVRQFCRPLCNAWMDVFMLSGAADKIADRLGIPRIPARDYYVDRDLFQQVEWRTPAWDWVDPVKDLQTIVGKIRAGLMSRSAAIRQLGYDPIQVEQEIKEDNERADDNDMVFDSDPRRTTKNGQGTTVVADGEQPMPQESGAAGATTEADSWVQ